MTDEQEVAEEVVRRCGHHDTVLVYIETRNPESGVSDGAPWGWRCIHCFPEAFPGFRRPTQRLHEVQAVITLIEDELASRRFYSHGTYGDEADLERWAAELRLAVATHREVSPHA